MNKLTRLDHDVIVTPDMCGKTPEMTPAAFFLLFQNAACMHAEIIGNGTSVLAEDKRYWVTTHTRIDLKDSAHLMEKLTVGTWPNAAKPTAVRANRSYELKRGEQLVAEGLTEWIVLDRAGDIVRYSEFGFPQDFEYETRAACGGKLHRYKDIFTDEELIYRFAVRASNIDTGRHMNNVAYIRAFLDCFSADELAQMQISSMEARYIVACMEGEEIGIYKTSTETGYLLGARRSDGKCAAIMSISLK